MKSRLLVAIMMYAPLGMPWVASPEARAQSSHACPRCGRVYCVCPRNSPRPAPDEARLDVNATVVSTAREFERSYGALPYRWVDGATGSPVPVVFDGKLILEGDPYGVHCSGFTFAVAMKAMESFGTRNYRLRDSSHMRAFQREWFAATDDSEELGPIQAMRNFGLGTQVHRMDDARSGDFVQMWRENGSGHSAVLLDLISENGQVVGIRYLSAQQTETNGIGVREEYFSDNRPYYVTTGGHNTPVRREMRTPKTGTLDRGRFYVGRLLE